MHPEAAFLAGYAVALVLVAMGLESLARRPSNAWASRTLAAFRPPDEQPRDDEADWPHSEVPVFHLGLSAVALAAALLITTVSTLRHHGPVELIIHGAVLVLITTRIHHLLARRRTLAGSDRHRPPRDTISTADERSDAAMRRRRV